MSACSASCWRCGTAPYLAAVPYLHLLHFGRGQVLILEPEVLQRPRPVRSGLDMSSFTCRTCRSASCACSSHTSWGRHRKCVSHSGRGEVEVLLHSSSSPHHGSSSGTPTPPAATPSSVLGGRNLVTPRPRPADSVSCMPLRFHHWFCKKKWAGLLVFLPSAHLHL